MQGFPNIGNSMEYIFLTTTRLKWSVSIWKLINLRTYIIIVNFVEVSIVYFPEAINHFLYHYLTFDCKL